MITCEMDKLTPSARKLVKDRVASRVHAKDDTLYAFDADAQECARHFMGWTTLASDPDDLSGIQAFAEQVWADGFDTAVLIGQGGSTQAPMTITKYNKISSNRMTFRTIDSDSPVRVRELMAIAKPATTLYVVSSKSGTTTETCTMASVLRRLVAREVPAAEVPQHFVAVTDPGTPLEAKAREEGWRAVFNGRENVGGRFSALSVFGLLPAALVGIDLRAFIARAKEAECRCSEDAIDNPAIGLAAFLYDNYRRGRDKFCFLTPKRGRVLGLWIEQLVAESLGKHGKGILPNIEVDSLLLTEDPGDRSVVMYETKNDLWDEQKNYEMSLTHVNASIPRLNFKIDDVEELAEHFVMWEYAIAMCGYLMKCCPFDQPDVASTKAAVKAMLTEGIPEPLLVEDFYGNVLIGESEVRVSQALLEKAAARADVGAEADAEVGTQAGAQAVSTLNDALRLLFGSIKRGDYFAVNAFLPFTGEFRREALESIRHDVARFSGVVSCLEVGPRYLHSTGQLQKGGSNKGVFLVVSAGELKDIPVAGEACSLGTLAKTQAVADWQTLSERGRRAVHVHLPDNSGVTLRLLAFVVKKVFAELDSITRAAL